MTPDKTGPSWLYDDDHDRPPLSYAELSHAAAGTHETSIERWVAVPQSECDHPLEAVMTSEHGQVECHQCGMVTGKVKLRHSDEWTAPAPTDQRDSEFVPYVRWTDVFQHDTGGIDSQLDALTPEQADEIMQALTASSVVNRYLSDVEVELRLAQQQAMRAAFVDVGTSMLRAFNDFTAMLTGWANGLIDTVNSLWPLIDALPPDPETVDRGTIIVIDGTRYRCVGPRGRRKWREKAPARYRPKARR